MPPPLGTRGPSAEVAPMSSSRQVTAEPVQIAAPRIWSSGWLVIAVINHADLVAVDA
jgi:hypothetical protein